MSAVLIFVGHCYRSYKNPTKRCSWHASERGKYGGVIFVESIIVAVIFQSFCALILLVEKDEVNK